MIRFFQEKDTNCFGAMGDDSENHGTVPGVGSDLAGGDLFGAPKTLCAGKRRRLARRRWRAGEGEAEPGTPDPVAHRLPGSHILYAVASRRAAGRPGGGGQGGI